MVSIPVRVGGTDFGKEYRMGDLKMEMYANTGETVVNKKSGKYGVVLREFPTGQIQVLEQIAPQVICTHDSWDTLERVEE